MSIINCRETTVTGCQIFEPKYRGLYIAGSRNTRVSDNVVMERGEVREMLAAIEVTVGSRNTVIDGNLLGVGSQGDLIVAEGTATVGTNHPVVE